MKYLIIILVLFASCKPTEYASQKQINKVAHFNPHLLSKYCGEKYAIKSDTLRPKPIIIRHTDTIEGEPIYVNCDSVLAAKKDNPNLDAPSIVAVKCPPSTRTVDTVNQPIIIIQENFANLTAEQVAHAKTKSLLDNMIGANKLWKTITIVVSIALLLSIIVIVLILKRKATLI